MGGKGHRWEKEGPHKKAKYKTPTPDVSEFMKKVTASAGKIGRDNEGGKFDVTEERKKLLKLKEEASERDENIRQQGERDKDEREKKRKELEEKRSPEGIRRLMDSLRPGKVDNKFYGHVVASDFKRTSIISTSGRVR
jgi:hypothetical protein